MEDYAFLLFDLVICIVEGYLYYNFCFCFLQNRYKEQWRNTSIMAVGILLLFGINHFHLSVLNLMASWAIYIGFCIILFKDNIRKKLYTWFVGWFIMVCSEFVATGILQLTWGVNTISETGTPGRVLLSTVMSKIITLFVFKLICNEAKASKNARYPKATADKEVLKTN